MYEGSHKCHGHSHETLRSVHRYRENKSRTSSVNDPNSPFKKATFSN